MFFTYGLPIHVQVEMELEFPNSGFQIHQYCCQNFLHLGFQVVFLSGLQDENLLHCSFQFLYLKKIYIFFCKIIILKIIYFLVPHKSSFISSFILEMISWSSLRMGLFFIISSWIIEAAAICSTSRQIHKRSVT